MAQSLEEEMEEENKSSFVPIRPLVSTVNQELICLDSDGTSMSAHLQRNHRRNLGALKDEERGLMQP